MTQNSRVISKLIGEAVTIFCLYRDENNFIHTLPSNTLAMTSKKNASNLMATATSTTSTSVRYADRSQIHSP
jgi:hypothetical protein